jgi:hypothetical protein
MDKKRRVKSLFPIFVITALALVGLFPTGIWAQTVPPSVVSTYPSDWPTANSKNIGINTSITIQFDMTMTTFPEIQWIEVQDRGVEQGSVSGTTVWTTTLNTNDTLVFTPDHPLKFATCYRFQGSAGSATGSTWFRGTFVTKPSSADVTPPTVQTVSPYNGKTGVSTGERIFLKFSEQMNPGTINSTNITVSGLSSSDYTVMYDPEDMGAEIRKSTLFSSNTPYTVTLNTSVRDVRGNALKTPYSWTFTTTASPDITPPTVQQTIPANSASKVSPNSLIHVIFSEEMDETTLIASNITVTNPGPVAMNVQDVWEDLLIMNPVGGSFAPGTYNVTLGTGTGFKDRSGNLMAPYSWSFTVPSSGDTAPVIQEGTYPDDQIGIRSPGGVTAVDLYVSAWDNAIPFVPLTIRATSGLSSWSLLNPDPSLHIYSDYFYSTSAGSEGLTNGAHEVTFSVKDGAVPQNEVSFKRNIIIFDANPTLVSPTTGATGVSTTPTFQWSYGGTSRPFYYVAAIFDGPDVNNDQMVWAGYAIDKGSGTHTVTIPADNALRLNKTYYWGVMGGSKSGNGNTFSDIFPFTTAGTPPPATHFASPWRVGNDDFIDPPGPGLRGQIFVKVQGPSPADIAELKVNGPAGFQYIFTEDDLATSEKNGQYFGHQFPSYLSPGTYTFSVTDLAGRTVNADKVYTAVSLPRVDDTTMTPADNTYVNTTTPILSWGSAAPGIYYRVTIWDWNNAQSPVYSSDLTQDTRIIVPPGYLFPDTSYNWRVDVLDFPVGANRTRSRNLQFHTGDSGPAPTLASLTFFNDNNYYSGIGKSMSFLVRGILPGEITQLHMGGPGIAYDFQQSNVFGTINPGTIGNLYTYGLFDASGGANGSYTISLQSPRGNPSLTKDVTPSTIPIVDQSSLIPGNNAYLTTLTPLLAWSGVTGSPRYYRVQIQDWRNRYTIYTSSLATSSSATIPAGILKPYRSYKWRVEAFDASTTTGTSGADNRSESGWNCFTTPGGGKLTDFDGDWKSDILWRHTASGTVATWLMNGGAIASVAVPATIGTGWQIKGTGDFDDDGKTDILWQETTSGTVAIWFMNGGTIASVAVPASIGTDWQIKGVRDFNGDGKADILWQQTGTGTVAIWFMNGGTIASVAIPDSIGPSWQIKGVRDFNGDGMADILWQETASGTVAIWFMRGGAIASVEIPGAIGPEWQIKGTGDFNSDGRADILWQHPASGTVAIWFMDGGMITSVAVPAAIGPEWQIKGTGDLNDDGYGDIIWQQPTSGNVAIWFMNGGTIASVAVPASIPSSWQIMN